jgi:hypothetical protein
MRTRTREEFAGLEPVEPGVVSAPAWRAEPGPVEPLDVVCGVGRRR